jgi:putative hemolysin
VSFPLTLPATLSVPRRAAFRAVRPLLSSLCQLTEYEALYRRTRVVAGDAFYTRALRALDITVDVRTADGGLVPARGPVIVAANHPHGIVDGLALAEIVGRIRPDVRVLTNRLLSALPELADMCLFVDAFGRRAHASHSGLRSAKRWLQGGGALVVFPAGAVAHDEWETLATPDDNAWHDTVGRLALGSGAPVIPARISGRNRDVFYLAGRWHRMLRTLLLPRELLAKRGARVQVALGTPMIFNRHATDRTRGKTVTNLVRAEVARLGDRPARARTMAIVEAASAESLRAEIAALDDCKLIAGDTIDVYCATADRIPVVLREIGRLREVTFRSVGEGTGQSIDLDRFDGHYRHLFAWDRQASAVAGAYRLAQVHDVVGEHGVKGLYTSTLFRFDEQLLAGLGPAMELGRSFVRAEYQRSTNVLMLLWKGIAQCVLASDGCRVLFGPVSISARYRDESRSLLQGFLTRHASHQQLSAFVTGLTPPMAAERVSSVPDDLQQLDHTIASIEPDGKGIPVLLRQYLRLNAKLLAFNIDHAFGDALDALMVVDLAVVNRALLTRYFGHDGAARVLAYRLSRAA